MPQLIYGLFSNLHKTLSQKHEQKICDKKIIRENFKFMQLKILSTLKTAENGGKFEGLK